MKNLKYEVISKARKDERVSLNMIEFLKKLNSHTYIGQDVNINKEQIAKNLEITKDELNSNLTKLEELGYIKIVKDKDHTIEDRYMINVPHEKITFELLLNLQEKATEHATDNIFLQRPKRPNFGSGVLGYNGR